MTKPDPSTDRGILVSVRLPRRPRFRDPTVRRLVEFAEALYYVFWLIVSAVTVVLVLVNYGPSVFH